MVGALPLANVWTSIWRLEHYDRSVGQYTDKTRLVHSEVLSDHIVVYINVTCFLLSTAKYHLCKTQSRSGGIFMTKIAL